MVQMYCQKANFCQFLKILLRQTLFDSKSFDTITMGKDKLE